MTDILKELRIFHIREKDYDGCTPDCPACAVLKAKPLLIAEGKRQMIKDYYCEHCSTPGFAHIIIPIKVYEALTGDK